MSIPITLNTQQQVAIDAFFAFLVNPDEKAFVISGYSGTGKSTLVKEILKELPIRLRAIQLLLPDFHEYPVALTATTNKAAENLAFITGQEVSTIHSYLGLRVNTDYTTGVTTLTPSNKAKPEYELVFVDEASFVDSHLLDRIFKQTKNCKIVFIGDPAQLTPVKTSKAPVFAAGFPGAELTQVVRQAEGNPIIALATKFRNTVNTGEYFQFVPDGQTISHVDRTTFNNALMAEFTRPNWNFRDSKVMGWTNHCVIGYNHAINAAAKGTPVLRVGDYAVCNSYLQAGKYSIKTDQTVLITQIGPDTESFDVDGNFVELDHMVNTFFPKSRDAAKARLNQAKKTGDYDLVRKINESWADLRAAYASTINKAQGSTFDRVYIDLDDIKECSSRNQIARMLYVGVSRARHQVVLTGDLV